MAGRFFCMPHSLATWGGGGGGGGGGGREKMAEEEMVAVTLLERFSFI